MDKGGYSSEITNYKYTTASNALKSESFDKNYSTYSNCDATGNPFLIKVDSRCWNNYATLYTTCTGSFIRGSTTIYYGCIAFYDKDMNILNSGYIQDLTGGNMAVLNAKSVQIPANTYWIQINDGTFQSNPYYVYEIWCSTQNLTGRTF